MRVAGEFRPSYTNEKLKSDLKRVQNESVWFGGGPKSGIKGAFETSYNTFLREKTDLPRLSILTNYNQIMRIMTKNYVKTSDYDKHFRNSDDGNASKIDDTYMKQRQEMMETQKMSKILKSLNRKQIARDSRLTQSSTLTADGGKPVQRKVMIRRDRYSTADGGDTAEQSPSFNENMTPYMLFTIATNT